MIGAVPGVIQYFRTNGLWTTNDVKSIYVNSYDYLSLTLPLVNIALLQRVLGQLHMLVMASTWTCPIVISGFLAGGVSIANCYTDCFIYY